MEFYLLHQFVGSGEDSCSAHCSPTSIMRRAHICEDDRVDAPAASKSKHPGTVLASKLRFVACYSGTRETNRSIYIMELLSPFFGAPHQLILESQVRRPASCDGSRPSDRIQPTFEGFRETGIWLPHIALWDHRA